MHDERRWYNAEMPNCNARKTLIAKKILKTTRREVTRTLF